MTHLRLFSRLEDTSTTTGRGTGVPHCDWCEAIAAALGPHAWDCAAIQRDGPRDDSACDCDAALGAT